MSSTKWSLPLFFLPLLGAVAGPTGERSLEENDFSPAAQCGKCHEEIHRQWKRSMHARSFSDPVYRFVFERMIAATGRRNQVFCLSCHAPVAAAAGSLLSRPSPLRWDEFSALAAEGVTCDFCHTIAANPELGGRILIGGYRIPEGGQVVKFGPHGDAGKDAHPVRASRLLASSQFCAGCHSFKHPVLAVEVQNTYEEWRASPYARDGIQCQDCHMPASEGAAVDDGGPAATASHGIEGGRGILIEKALELNLTAEIEQMNEARFLLARATVRNVGAGHSVPTGIPGIRELWLEIVVEKGGLPLASGRFMLGQRLLDESGAEALPWEAYELVEDRRLRPGEAAEQDLEVPLLRGTSGSLLITARLMYQMVSENLSRRLDLPAEPARSIAVATLEVEAD